MKINNQKNQFIFPHISTYNYNNSSTDNFCACDKQFKNKNVISNISERTFMKEEDCRQFEIEKNGMRVILEFPIKTNNEVFITNEVQPILVGILQEHLNKIS